MSSYLLQGLYLLQGQWLLWWQARIVKAKRWGFWDCPRGGITFHTLGHRFKIHALARFGFSFSFLPAPFYISFYIFHPVFWKLLEKGLSGCLVHHKAKHGCPHLCTEIISLASLALGWAWFSLHTLKIHHSSVFWKLQLPSSLLLIRLSFLVASLLCT